MIATLFFGATCMLIGVMVGGMIERSDTRD